MILINDLDFTLYVGDAIEVLAGLNEGEVDCMITSPPYLDARPEYPTLNPDQWRLFFHHLRRVVVGPALFNVGRLWVNGTELLWWTSLLDYARAEDWRLLDTLVWVKPNANPIHGRVLANSHEYVLILGDQTDRLNTDAVRTPYAEASIGRMGRKWINGRGVKGDERSHQDGRELNPEGARARSYIEIPVGREKGNPHPAPMALDLAEHLVRLGSFPGQTILDPFLGSGTTALAARKFGRSCIGIELSAEYADMAAERLSQQSLLA